MARVLRILNWLIQRLSEQYGNLEEPEPAQLPHAKTHPSSDEHKPF